MKATIAPPPVDHTQTQQIAAEWLARLMAPGSTELDRAAFERWRRRNPEHARAVAEIERLWGRVDELLERNTHIRQLAEDLRFDDELFDDVESFNGKFEHWDDFEDFEVPTQTWAETLADALPADQKKVSARNWRPPSSNWLFSSMLAVGTVAGAYGAWAWWQHDSKIPEPVTYTTAADELRPLSLQDGSIIDLDTSTALAVQFKEGRLRHAELQSGRALFDVAYDDRTPFKVDLGHNHLVAAGGRFQLQRENSRITITVLDGAVTLGPKEGPGAALIGAQLNTGDQISYSVDKPDVWFRRDVMPRTVGGWSRGRLVFNGTPLVDVVDEVNRYMVNGGRKLQLNHPVLNTLSVTGNFPMGDSTAAAAALIRHLPLKAAVPKSDDGSGDIILSYRGVPSAKMLKQAEKSMQAQQLMKKQAVDTPKDQAAGAKDKADAPKQQ